MLKNLINKPNQSPIVIVQLIKFSTNKIFTYVETSGKNNDNTSVLDNEDTHSKNIVIEPDANDLNSTNNSNNSDNDTLRQFMAVLKILIMDNTKNTFIFNSEEEKIKLFKSEFYEHYKNGKFKSIRQLIIDLFIMTEEEDYIKNQNTISNFNSMLKDKDQIEVNSLKSVVTDPNVSNIVTLQRNSTNNSGLNSSTLRKYNPSSIYQLTSSTNTSNIVELKTDGNNFKFNNNPKLPFARIAVDATLTINQINSTFLKEMKKLGFEVLGNETSDYCKAEKRKFDIFNTIMKCFRSDSTRENESNLTSLYLMTKFSEHNKFERIIEVVGLTGKNEELSQTIEHFLKKLRVHNKKLRPLRVQDINTKVLDSKRSKSSEKLNKEKG